jgi:hypothetical protein
VPGTDCRRASVRQVRLGRAKVYKLRAQKAHAGAGVNDGQKIWEGMTDVASEARVHQQHVRRHAGGARALQSLSTVTVYGCAKRE